MKTVINAKLLTPLNIWKLLLDDPVDFLELSIEGRSGNRLIKGLITLADPEAKNYKCMLPGNNFRGQSADTIDWIMHNISQYDSCRLILRLRGQSQLIEADNKGVRLLPNYVEKAIKNKASEPHSYGTSDKRKYKIQIDEAQELLQSIGIIDQNGKLKNDKYRKYHQIDRFVELAEPILQQLVEADDQSLEIYDLACGKSYLSFVLNYYIREKLAKTCNFTGIDISDQVIASSVKLADKLKYRNMTFEKMDLRLFNPKGKVSLCISLHACDTATDLALATAVKAGSKAILAVPCCQRELLAAGFSIDLLASSVMTSGILKARLADLITDGMRMLLLRSAGYDVSIIEYISPLETPKNLMIRAVKKGPADQEAWDEYLALKSELNASITLGRELEGYIRHRLEKQL